MDSHLFEEEEEVSYLDIMSTREHMEYILNYPDKPLISTRFPKLGRNSLDQISPRKISSSSCTVDSKYFIGQEMRLNTTSRRSSASSSSYGIALRQMMNGNLNSESPLRPPNDGTVQFVENLYSRLNKTSTPLLKTKAKSKTNSRFSYPIPNSMEREMNEVGYNGDHANQTGREGEVSYVKSVINFYERKENVARRTFNAESRSSSDFKSSRRSGTTITTTTGTTPTTDVVATNEDTSSKFEKPIADISISKINDQNDNNIAQEDVKDIRQVKDDENGHDKGIPVDRSLPEEETLDSFDQMRSAPNDIESNNRQEDETTFIDDENTPATAVSLSILLLESIPLPHSAVELMHDTDTSLGPEDPATSVEGLQGESKFSSLSDADDDRAIEASEPAIGVEELSTLPGSDDHCSNSFVVHESLSDAPDSAVLHEPPICHIVSNQEDIDGSESRHDENQDSLLLGSVESLQTVVPASIITSDAVLSYADTSIETDAYDSTSSSEADNQEYASTAAVDHDSSPSQDRSVVEVDNSTNDALGKKQFQFVTVEYSAISTGDSLGVHTATLSEYNQQSDVSDSSSVFESMQISFDFEEYGSTAAVDHDPSPSQDRSVVVEVDNSTNNALEEKQLQFVTVEYSPINSGDSLGMHTATLSEYNQQSEVSDSSSVLEPVEISFDFEPIENSVECHEKTSTQSFRLGVEIDFKFLQADEVERVAVVNSSKPVKVYKPALFGGCRSFLNF